MMTTTTKATIQFAGERQVSTTIIEDYAGYATELWQKVAKSMLERKGLYVTVSTTPSKTVTPAWDCPLGGFDAVTLTVTHLHPSQFTEEEWKQSVLEIVSAVKYGLQPKICTVEFAQVDYLDFSS